MTELTKIELDGVEEGVPFDPAELGAMMREMRQSMQRDLKDVAQELRIRRPYLEAIEDGRLDDLPGPAYTTGFLRAYSDYLGLDGEETVARFKQAGIDMDRRTNLVLPSPLEEGRLPTGFVLLVAALLAVMVYGGWFYVSSGDQASDSEVAAVPSEYEAVAKAGRDKDPVSAEQAVSPDNEIMVDGADGAATAENTTGETAAETEAAALSGDGTTSADTETVAADDTPSATVEEPSATAASTVEQAPAQVASTQRPVTVEPPVKKTPTPEPAPVIAARRSAPEPVAAATVSRPDRNASRNTSRANRGRRAANEIAPAVQAASSGDAKIIVRATEDSWVEIRVGRGKPLLSRLMREGESFEVASRPGLKLVTGNAGGVALEVDGKAIPPLGPAGDILQDVAIDAASLLKRVP